MTTRAVGFDLDHTLAVPDRDRHRILAAAVDDVDAPRITREEYLSAHRDDHAAVTRSPIFETVLPADADVEPEALAGAYRRRIADALSPVDGARDLLDALRADYSVGLLTNGPVKAQGDKLDELGWWTAFDATLVTGQLPAGKPDPRAFDALAGALGVAVEDVVYVGDEPVADVEGATNAGARAVQVVWPDGPDPHPAAAAVVDREHIARDLGDVIRGLD
ncbi:HAD family hydrolase [Halorubellus sp. PRR65]|uniref:HAD family hydrolase n=1 Tax=Halorubellus sp. PRR65 TaxID=3098148 RepID=UPI002B2604CB|nr:HAD family hydrolase [Halorubellus sp. PRR65]